MIKVFKIKYKYPLLHHKYPVTYFTSKTTKKYINIFIYFKSIEKTNKISPIIISTIFYRIIKKEILEEHNIL